LNEVKLPIEILPHHSLASMAKSPDLNLKIFKKLDKACQDLYEEHKNAE
jgi:hypothetical protein